LTACMGGFTTLRDVIVLRMLQMVILGAAESLRLRCDGPGNSLAYFDGYGLGASSKLH
jgi:hypothetical protein